MKVTHTALPGVVLFEPTVFPDPRGLVFEVWNRQRYAAIGLSEDFVQDNVSLSKHGVLRGLHYQHPDAQGKLVSALRGRIYDVAVDIRVGSPTFRRWVGVILDDDTRGQLYIPPGFAHGFQVLSADALVLYKLTRLYDPRGERSILWSDEDIAIDWQDDPIISAKDAKGLRLRELAASSLPSYTIP